MKKIALTSMLAVFAASSAMAAHVSNPLYVPAAGEFYSITDAMSATNTDIDIIAPFENAGMGTTGATVTETFGFGLTDWLSASVKAAASTQNWFDLNTFNDLGVALNARFVNHEGWLADLFGGYSVGNIRGTHANEFFAKEETYYTWTAGVRGGYTTGAWTVAAHAALDYGTPESFKWTKSQAADFGITDEEGRVTEHVVRLGLDGQLYLNQNWNVVAGAEYAFMYDADQENSWSNNGGYWKGTFGINYDFNPCSFVGAYVSKIMVHSPREVDGEMVVVPDEQGFHEEHATSSAGNWDIVDGFIFGAKFGVKF